MLIEVEDQVKLRPTARAKETRYILRVNARIVGFVIPYFVEISGRPGAIIALPSGETNV